MDTLSQDGRCLDNSQDLVLNDFSESLRTRCEAGSALAAHLRFEEAQRVLPLETSNFILEANGMLATEVITQLIGDDRAAAILGQESNEVLQEGMPELLQGLHPFYRVESVAVGNETEAVTAVLEEEGVLAENPAVAGLLQQDITSEVVHFLNAVRLPEVEMRIFCETKTVINEMLSSFLLPDSREAAETVAKNVNDLGYDESFVYHQDDYGVNLIKSYGGAGTICMDPQALSKEQGMAMMDHWIHHFFGEDGLGAEVKGLMDSGDRFLALEKFRTLLKVVWGHQLHFDGSGNSEALPYEFPKFRSTVYLGDMEQYENHTPNLLLHARPMCFLTEPEEKRFAILLATQRRQSVAHLRADLSL